VKFAGRNVDFSPGGSVLCLAGSIQNTQGPQINIDPANPPCSWENPDFPYLQNLFRTSLVKKTALDVLICLGLKLCAIMRMDGDHRDFLYVSGLAGKAALEARNSHRGSHPIGPWYTYPPEIME
jgi:hypothetical protein